MRTMRWETALIFKSLGAILILLFPLTHAIARSKPETRKKIVVKKFQQHDFTGQTVQGSLRAPEVFYIFQRKRSEGHQVVRTPSNLDHHRKPTVQVLQKELHP